MEQIDIEKIKERIWTDYASHKLSTEDFLQAMNYAEKRDIDQFSERQKEKAEA